MLDTHSVPTWDLGADRKLRIRNSLMQSLVTHTSIELALPTDRLKVRDLFPRDLGLKNWDVEKLEWIFHTIASETFIGIYKITQLCDFPTVNQIELVLSNNHYVNEISNLYGILPLLRKIKETSDTEILQVQYGLENLRMEAWFPSPYVVKQNQEIRVYAHSDSGVYNDKLVLSGMVVEPITYDDK